MDADRFDALARTLGARLPRRALGGLVAALTAVGLEEADAKERRNGKPGKETRRDNERGRAGNSGGLQDEGKKKKRKGKKKGRKSGNGAGSGDTGGGDGTGGGGGGGTPCQAGLQACNGGCVPQDEPCCTAGTRLCDGSCVGADACCETGFFQCISPIVADWTAATDSCAAVCADLASSACRDCTEGVLETFVEPLVRCLQINCPRGSSTAGAAERRSAQVTADAVKTCDPRELNICQIKALIQNLGTGAAASLAGLVMEGPLGGLGPAIMSIGQVDADFRICEQKFGCPGGYCNRGFGDSTGYCCPTGKCETYDPSTQTCRGCTAPDTRCNYFSQTCEHYCKQCHHYLVDGRKMPCGQITNNCGQVLTCNGCSGNDRCVNRRCVQLCPSGARAAASECCMPKTCDELGQTCGRHDDGCGGTVYCGECDCTPLPCGSDPDHCTNFGDACGRRINCTCAPGKICSERLVSADNQRVCCRPKTCADYANQPYASCSSDGCTGKKYAVGGALAADCQRNSEPGSPTYIQC